MSTRINSLLGIPDDPREIELTRSLLEKTRQGKIPWIKQGNALTATIPSGVQTNFVLSPVSLLGSSSNWELFTVRDRSGNELVRIGNPSFAAMLVGQAVNPLADAANELFKAVYGAVGDDLDRAINAIKKL
jgi:hypothetical protein